jgi:predicted secreted protein
MCLFIVLPLRIKSQQENGEIVPGTPASSPTNPQLKKKTIYVTIVTFILWILLVYIISSGLIRVQDIAFFNRT